MHGTPKISTLWWILRVPGTHCCLCGSDAKKKLRMHYRGVTTSYLYSGVHNGGSFITRSKRYYRAFEIVLGNPRRASGGFESGRETSCIRLPAGGSRHHTRGRRGRHNDKELSFYLVTVANYTSSGSSDPRQTSSWMSGQRSVTECAA